MTTRRTLSTFAVLAVLGTLSIGAAVVQNTGPVYPMEGAWYGMVTIGGLGSTPSLDTFTSAAQRHGVEGTFLCTADTGRMPNPSNQEGWLATTPSGHGSWVRTGTNRFAFTAVRTVSDESGSFVGWAKFWGTITPISDSEYTGTMNAQFYLPNGTAFSPVFTGTLHSYRLEIVFEQ